MSHRTNALFLHTVYNDVEQQLWQIQEKIPMKRPRQVRRSTCPKEVTIRTSVSSAGCSKKEARSSFSSPVAFLPTLRIRILPDFWESREDSIESQSKRLDGIWDVESQGPLLCLSMLSLPPLYSIVSYFNLIRLYLSLIFENCSSSTTFRCSLASSLVMSPLPLTWSWYRLLS